MMYFKYLSYIVRHKWFVFLECCKSGIPLLGFIHDWSKFLPGEFIPYARHFYGKGRDIKYGRDKTGYYKAGDTGDYDFDFAWLLHQKRNKHHWQWWILPEDDGGTVIFEMPIKYRKEMLCDWKGAGRAQNTPDVKAWYEKNHSKLRLGPETRRWIVHKLFGLEKSSKERKGYAPFIIGQEK